MAALGRERRINVSKQHYTNEYIRLSSLDLVCEEIYQNSVPGKIAELGVYRGTFAAEMNRAFPDKELFLFDTFQGFNQMEELVDQSKFNLTYKRDFTDTSVEEVLSIMPNKELCIIKKGFFPDTAKDLLNEKFCFVSIDTDLYSPILAGLEFFWPRLEKGGYIFVHDYNNNLFPGAKRAVQEFSKTNGISYTPLTDVYGSAIFCK